MTLFGHPLHPMTVHFPIAFYILGLGLTLVYLWRNQTHVEQFAYWSFVLSWLASLLASLAGLIDQSRLEVNDPRQDAVNNHITAGVAVIVLNGLIVYMRLRWPDVLVRHRWPYLGLVALGLGVVLAAGWLGGELVYRLGVNVGR